MLDIAAVIPIVLRRLKKLATGHYLDLQTYKKDRSVLIVKQGEDDFLLIENGFQREEFRADATKLKKLLKTLLKKEFPRSNKVRLYSGEYAP